MPHSDNADALPPSSLLFFSRQCLENKTLVMKTEKTTIKYLRGQCFETRAMNRIIYITKQKRYLVKGSQIALSEGEKHSLEFLKYDIILVFIIAP